MASRETELWRSWTGERDARAFERLVGPELAHAVGWARRLGCSPHAADDAVQEALLRLARCRDDKPLDLGIRTWLCREVRTRARSRLRSKRRRLRREAAVATRDVRTSGASSLELREVVELALRQLPHHEREAVELRYLHDLDYANVATVLAISEGACRQRVHRAMARLRTQLGLEASALIGLIPLPVVPAASELMSVATTTAASASTAAVGGVVMATATQKLTAVAVVACAAGIGGTLVVQHALPANGAETPVAHETQRELLAARDAEIERLETQLAQATMPKLETKTQRHDADRRPARAPSAPDANATSRSVDEMLRHWRRAIMQNADPDKRARAWREVQAGLESDDRTTQVAAIKTIRFTRHIRLDRRDIGDVLRNLTASEVPLVRAESWSALVNLHAMADPTASHEGNYHIDMPILRSHVAQSPHETRAVMLFALIGAADNALDGENAALAARLLADEDLAAETLRGISGARRMAPSLVARLRAHATSDPPCDVADTEARVPEPAGQGRDDCRLSARTGGGRHATRPRGVGVGCQAGRRRPGRRAAAHALRARARPRPAAEAPPRHRPSRGLLLPSLAEEHRRDQRGPGARARRRGRLAHAGAARQRQAWQPAPSLTSEAIPAPAPVNPMARRLGRARLVCLEVWRLSSSSSSWGHAAPAHRCPAAVSRSPAVAATRRPSRSVGYVKRATLAPQADIPVVILGHDPVVSDDDGRFEVQDVAVPYTAVVISDSNQSARAYVGLTRPDPTFLTSERPGPRYTAEIDGTILGGAGFPEPANHHTRMWAEVEDAIASISPSVNDATGAYHAWGFSWRNEVGTDVKLHALQWEASPVTGLPMTYTGYGVGETAVVHEDTLFGVPVQLDPVGTDMVGAQALLPPGYAPTAGFARIQRTDRSLWVIQDYGLDSTAFTYAVPTIATKTRYEVGFRADPIGEGTDAFVTVWRRGVSPGELDLIFKVPEIAGPVLPVDDAQFVTYDTEFMAEERPGRVYIFHQYLKAPYLTVYTSQPTCRFPDLSAYGLGFAPGESYGWDVVSTGPYPNVDAYVGPAGPDRPNGSWYLAYGDSRHFTMAP